MSLPDARPEILDFLGNQPAIGPVGGRLRGGSGPFPSGPSGERVGLACTFADAQTGRRQRALVSMKEWSEKKRISCGVGKVK